MLVVGADRVAGRWPGTLALYRSIGLVPGPAGAGLAFQNVSATAEDANGKALLVVRGEVTNMSTVARPLRPLHIRLMDAADRQIISWSVAPHRALLGRGETIPFQAVVPQPQSPAKTAMVTFGS